MRILSVIVILLSCIAGTSSLRADTGAWFKNDLVQMRLISASQTAGNGQALSLGLEVLLQDNWKTYWRTPGDAGLAPQIFPDPIALQGAQAELHFPLPKRFSLFGLDTFGYGKRVLFPLKLTLTDPAQASMIKMTAELLICDDICVPVQAPLSLSLQQGAQTPSYHQQELAKIRSQLPRLEAGAVSLSLADTSLDREGKGHLIATTAQPLDIMDMLIEGPAGHSFAKPELLGNNQYLLKKLAGKTPLALGTPLQVTIDAASRPIEVPVMITASTAPLKTGQQKSYPLWLIALIGGFILNFMPCVLPVLSLKISHVLTMASSSPKLIRARFAMSAAGIITSFLLLSAFLQILRQFGQQIGWGIQFQSPLFLGMLFIVTAIFTLSLFDIVTFRTPAFVQKLMPRRTHDTSAATTQNHLIHDFGAGMLATLLATPCSAPFVGTAVSFALSQSDAVLYGIMFMMGVGLALPWLVFSVFPHLITYLPRPGQWMVRLKQILGLIMALTVLWVASLFAGSLGYRVDISSQQSTINWQTFDLGELDTLRASDRLIFVDVTADWCITCKANKTLTLETGEAISLFTSQNVTMIQADWTLPDDDIARFLASHQRFGIPFNIVYGPSARQGIILPEILTLADIEKALAQANQSQ